ncbi:GNAT family N-acetyltransferase [uncultured Cohaesibacter sp.]|uniref:GNAT family N-acetyltransferase n=1 Tax=uncultured Cohaesibacter sp. TaxID=1002546 RepID=UPI00292F1946|nr:GNAT family N-acetyltransferase [uncultured Cohaesibacter sp.]
MLETSRLLIREWKDSDLEPFADLNADPIVMEHLPGQIAKADSDAMAGRIIAHFETHGFGLYALEVKESGQFIGYTGLSVPKFEAPFMPAIEIGWRMARSAWGFGYATEAARAVLVHATGPLGLSNIVSFTVPQNTRSRAVMERIGLKHDPQGDFDHPAFEHGHRLRRHVLYRMA